MSKTKVAVIGCGTIGTGEHIPAYTKNPDVEIKYFIDIIPERAEASAEKYGSGITGTDFRMIFQDKEVTAVSICTPNNTHAPISIACLDAGINVFCEKPASTTYDLVCDMKTAAQRNNKILNIGVVNRFNTAVNKIKNIIERGELGEVYHVNTSFRAHRSIPGMGGAFTTMAESGGGVLIDWGVHYIDLAMYCINSPKVKTVSGVTHCKLGKNMKDYTYINMWAGPPNYDGTYDVDDYVSGFVRTEGPSMCVNGAWAQNIGEQNSTIEFLGDKAGIKLQYGGSFTMYTARDGVLYETKAQMKFDNMFYDELADFIECAKTGRKNRQYIDNVMQTAQILDSMAKSSNIGAEIAID